MTELVLRLLCFVIWGDFEWMHKLQKWHVHLSILFISLKNIIQAILSVFLLFLFCKTYSLIDFWSLPYIPLLLNRGIK